MSVLRVKTEDGYEPIGFKLPAEGWELIAHTVTEEDTSVISYELDIHKYTQFYFSMDLPSGNTFTSVYVTVNGYGNNLFSSYTTPSGSTHTLSGDIMVAPYGGSGGESGPMPIVFGRMAKSSNVSPTHSAAYLRYINSGVYAKDGIHFKGTFSAGTRVWLYAA